MQIFIKASFRQSPVEHHWQGFKNQVNKCIKTHPITNNTNLTDRLLKLLPSTSTNNNLAVLLQVTDLFPHMLLWGPLFVFMGQCAHIVVLLELMLIWQYPRAIVYIINNLSVHWKKPRFTKLSLMYNCTGEKIKYKHK